MLTMSTTQTPVRSRKVSRYELTDADRARIHRAAFAHDIAQAAFADAKRKVRRAA